MEVKDLIKQGQTISNLPLKVVFYARVSTDHELQTTSIKNQIDFFKTYIKNNKKWTLINGYVDEGISGKSVKKRENFLKMIQDAKNKKFNLILTKSVSRFARNTIDSIQYTEILLNYGIGVLFLNDNINTFYSDSEFRLTLMASIAQDELRKLSESVRFGLNQSINRGIVLGNNNLLGYKKNKGKLKIIKEEAKIVKEIFNLYIQNKYTNTTISKIINQKYHLNYDSKRINRIISNPKYKGYYCGRKSKVIDYKNNIRKQIDKKDWIMYKDNNNIPPIIEENIWNIANNIKSKKEKEKIKTKELFNKYNNIVSCNLHHNILKIKKKKYKNKYYGYLICPNCLSLSTKLLDKIYINNRFKKITVEKMLDNNLKIICQK